MRTLCETSWPGFFFQNQARHTSPPPSVSSLLLMPLSLSVRIQRLLSSMASSSAASPRAARTATDKSARYSTTFSVSVPWPMTSINASTSVAPHRRSFLKEAEIVDIRGPVRIRPRRAIAGKSRERIAADFLLVDDADIRTRCDLCLDLFLLDRRAGMRSAIWKRHALAPLGPDALLSEHAGTHHQRRQNHQASHSCPPVHGRPAIGPPEAAVCGGLSSGCRKKDPLSPDRI